TVLHGTRGEFVERARQAVAVHVAVDDTGVALESKRRRTVHRGGIDRGQVYGRVTRHHVALGRGADGVLRDAGRGVGGRRVDLGDAAVDAVDGGRGAAAVVLQHRRGLAAGIDGGGCPRVINGRVRGASSTGEHDGESRRADAGEQVGPRFGSV